MRTIDVRLRNAITDLSLGICCSDPLSRDVVVNNRSRRAPGRKEKFFTRCSCGFASRHITRRATVTGPFHLDAAFSSPSRISGACLEGSATRQCRSNALVLWHHGATCGMIDFIVARHTILLSGCHVSVTECLMDISRKSHNHGGRCESPE